MSNGYRDLKVYQLAYKLAMEIFEVSKTFPVEEKCSLDCNYITKEKQEKLFRGYEEVGRMLGGMADNPEKFLPK